MNRGYRHAILAGFGLFIVVLDQASKIYIMQTMHLHESIPIIPDVFNLTYIRNPGAAFGIFASSSGAFRMVFFLLTSLFALALLGHNFLSTPSRRLVGPTDCGQYFRWSYRKFAGPSAIWRGYRFSRLLSQRLPLASLQRRGQCDQPWSHFLIDPLCF